MKNVEQIAELSNKINSRDRNTWITLYYSIKEDAVYSTAGDGRFKIGSLINPNSPSDIVDYVEQWKRI